MKTEGFCTVSVFSTWGERIVKSWNTLVERSLESTYYAVDILCCKENNPVNSKATVTLNAKFMFFRCL
jgi:hypothetical protein